eukprot:g27056.t1
MEFNPDKCEVLHLGRMNKSREYMMNGKTLGSIADQSNLEDTERFGGVQGGNMIEMYKSMEGIDRAGKKELLPLVESDMTKGIDG